MSKIKKSQTGSKPARVVRRKPISLQKVSKVKPSRTLQRLQNTTGSMNTADVLMLQSMLGNQAVGRMIQQKRNREVNSPIQRNMEEGAGSFEVGANFESRLSQIGVGKPLDKETRNFMEPRFGADLGHIRLHTGGEAVQMNQEIGAEAFTHQNHIVMGETAQSPQTTAGKRLLAHEITHTFQQGASQVQPKRMGANKGNSSLGQKIQRLSAKPAGIQRAVPAYLSYFNKVRKEERSNWNPAKWFGKNKSEDTYKRGWYNPKRWFGNKYNHDALLNPKMTDNQNHFRQVLQDGGSWKRAVTAREPLDTQQLTANDTPKDTEMRRRNFNDFVQNTPVVILPQGTELIHMTSGSWGASSMPGGNATNNYTFFTLAQSGPATTHNNSFSQMIRMRVTRDVHLFFLPDYNTIKVGKDTSSIQKKLDTSQPSVGGDLKNNILNYFADYVPTAIAGHSEHELMFYNNIIPDIMAPARIASLNTTGTDISDNNLTDIYNPATNTDNRQLAYQNQHTGHVVGSDADLPDYAMNHWKLFKWFGPMFHTGKINPKTHGKFFGKLRDKVRSKRKQAVNPKTNLFNKNTWHRYRTPKKWWNQQVRGEDLEEANIKLSNLDVDKYLDNYLA